MRSSTRGGSDEEAAQSAERTCLQCRQSKTRCNKQSPCERCIRLDLVCQPQTRKRGRPLKLHKPRSQLLQELQQHQQPPEQGSPGEKSESPQVTSMAVMNEPVVAEPGVPVPPQVGVEAFRTGLKRLKTQGLLHSGRAMNILKLWAAEGYRRKPDITHGLLEYVGELIGQPEAAVMSVGPEDPNATEHDIDLLKDSSRVGHLPSFLERLDDRVSAFVGYCYTGGRWTHFTNDVFAGMFMTKEEIEENFNENPSFPSVIWGRVIAREDQNDFFQELIMYTFAPPQKGNEMSMIVKCIDRGGQTRHALARSRYMILLGGNWASLVLALTMLPGSEPPRNFGDSAGASSSAVGVPPGVPAQMNGTGAPSISLRPDKWRPQPWEGPPANPMTHEVSDNRAMDMPPQALLGAMGALPRRWLGDGSSATEGPHGQLPHAPPPPLQTLTHPHQQHQQVSPHPRHPPHHHLQQEQDGSEGDSERGAEETYPSVQPQSQSLHHPINNRHHAYRQQQDMEEDMAVYERGGPRRKVSGQPDTTSMRPHEHDTNTHVNGGPRYDWRMDNARTVGPPTASYRDLSTPASAVPMYGRSASVGVDAQAAFPAHLNTHLHVPMHRPTGTAYEDTCPPVSAAGSDHYHPHTRYYPMQPQHSAASEAQYQQAQKLEPSPPQGVNVFHGHPPPGYEQQMNDRRQWALL